MLMLVYFEADDNKFSRFQLLVNSQGFVCEKKSFTLQFIYEKQHTDAHLKKY